MMKRIGFYISVVVNICLLLILGYVILKKTDFPQRWEANRNHRIYVPERTDNDCVVSWTTSIRQLNYEADVVFFGNSITEGGNWQPQFSDVKIVNLGYIGEDTKGMLRRVVQIQSLHPKKVFIMAGINGLKYQTMDEFQTNYSHLIDSVRKALPQCEIYLESILPVTSKSKFCSNDKIIKANQWIKDFAGKNSFVYVDLFSLYAVDNSLPESFSYDGVHLCENAYNIWYEEVKRWLKNE